MEREGIQGKTTDYLNEIRSYVECHEPFEIVDHVLSLVNRSERWLDHSCINLYAASNLMSPVARSLLSSTIATRVAEGHPGAKHQRGTRYIERIEALATEVAKKLFHAKHAELRVLSGTMANAVTYGSLTKSGDIIMSLSVPDGGHISYREFGVAGLMGLRTEDLPFNKEKMNIDVAGLSRSVKKVKPKLIVLGGSLILFPYPLDDICEIAESSHCIIHYDAAHVCGLIAGGRFQDPLSEGADVMTASTYKTLGGPPGGLILSNYNDIAKRIDAATFPGATASIHYNRIAAIAVTLAELLKFGAEYAKQIVRNAKELARSLDDQGFDVLARDFGYTESHQVAVDVSGLGGGKTASFRLENANIICNSNLLPGDRLDMVWNPSGLRLGVQEVTRLGMKEKEMCEIAGFMRRVLIDKEKLERVSQEVEQFRSKYSRVHYCFRKKK